MCKDNKESRIVAVEEHQLVAGGTWESGSEEVLEFNVAKLFLLNQTLAGVDLAEGTWRILQSPDAQKWYGTNLTPTTGGMFYLQPLTARWFKLRFTAGATACRINVACIYTDKLVSAGSALVAV